MVWPCLGAICSIVKSLSSTPAPGDFAREDLDSQVELARVPSGLDHFLLSSVDSCLAFLSLETTPLFLQVFFLCFLVSLLNTLLLLHIYVCVFAYLLLICVCVRVGT